MGKRWRARNPKPTSTPRRPSYGIDSPKRSTAWTWSPSRPPPGAPSPAIRETGKPYFLECRTYRFRAHSMFDAQLYRDKEEIAKWREKGPIVRFQPGCWKTHLIHDSDIAEIEAEVDAEIAEAVAFAEAGTWEPVETLTRHVMAEEPAPPPVPERPRARRIEITYREAVKQAIRDAMIRDERVFLMGEDVGAYGGCYAVTKG
jgi:2-oxoisovalerate dehydrogenase E1 component